jgi:ubiquinone/menaquinone biosynthesis C-methylase UbiE
VTDRKGRDVREVDYDERQHRVYAQARALSAETMAEWMRVFEQFAPSQRPLAVLDLGSGTGRFTPALADTFGGPVHGVEPSERMREVAEEHAAHPAVTYLAGTAEAIPLPAASCDLVLLYLVLHHLRDLAAAATEIARVLRPGGRLLIRSSFPERMPELLWYSFFPGARRIDEQVFPRMDHVVEVFDSAGLSYVTVEEVQQRVAPSLAEYAERLRLRGSSTFERLTEEEIQDGFAALDAAVAAETRPRPVDEDSDVLVLQRRPDRPPGRREVTPGAGGRPHAAPRATPRPARRCAAARPTGCGSRPR